jgi:hypothetical protein
VAKKGRPLSDCWSYVLAPNFVGDEKLGRDEKSKHSTCGHCGLLVKHNGRPDTVEDHLNLCNPFSKYVQEKSLTIDWYKPNKGQSNTMKSYSYPKLHQSTIEAADISFAMAKYTSYESFRSIENPFLKRGVQLLHPSYKLPSRQRLADDKSEQGLLRICYEETEKTISERLKSMKLVCATTDGWSDIRNKPIMNYCLMNGVVDIFYKAVYAGKEKKDATYFVGNHKSHH